MKSSPLNDAWERRVVSIGQFGQPAACIPGAVTDSIGQAPSRRCHSAVVQVTCYLSVKAIEVEWSDPTVGRYSGQVWRKRMARNRGICLISGQSIRKGDEVYSPCTRGGIPRNAGAMISAGSVRGAGSEDDALER